MNIKKTIRKGYKPSPVGPIPKDWRIDTFGSICQKLLDGTHFSPKSKEGPFRYITSKNIRNNGLDLSNVNYVSEKEHREIYKRCPVKFGDILLTKDGAGTGACCKNTLKEEFSLLSSVAVLRSNSDKVANDYLIHFIKSPAGQKIIQDAISGQAITRITLEKIRSFKIVYPSVQEQNNISKLITTWDKALNNLTQLIAQKEFRKKTLMQQLLTGKKRLKGFKEKWKEVKLGNLLKLSSGDTKPKETMDTGIEEFKYPIYGGNGIMGYSKTYNLSGEKILIGRVGEYCGVTRKINGKYWITDNALYTVEFFESISTDFLAYKLVFENLSKLRNKGGQPLISQGPIYSKNIALPSFQEQTAIAKVLQLADNEIQLLSNKLDKLKEQKKGLMQILLTGKKRLI